MMVWDRGTYRNLTEKNAEEIPIKQALEKGHANIWLNAQKVKGGYSLTRIAKGKKERWLLVKIKDKDADARRNPIRSKPDSALTRRSLKEIERDESE